MADYSAGSAYLTVLPDMSNFGAQVRAELAKSNYDATVPLKPELDTAALDAEIADIEAKLRAISDAKSTLSVDDTDAKIKIDELVAKLNELQAKRAEIVTHAETEAAKIELDELKLKADELDGKTVNIRAKTDTGDSKDQIFSLMTAGIALGPAIIPVAAAVAAALAGIGTGAVIGGAALGAVVLGFHGVGAAVTDLDTVQQTQGKNATQLAAQQISSANSVASAQDGVRNAVTGVADAERSSAIANQQAAETTANAQRSLQDAYISVGISVQNALQSETQAEQTLANAQQQEQLAQESLTLARQAAQRQIESLTLAVEDGALAERQAQLNITKAKQALDQTLANPTATVLQRQQAQLTYDQSLQQLKDIQVRNANNAQDKAAADAKGVDGSQQVQAAQRGVASATQAVGNAQQGLATAQRNVDEARRKGAEQIMVAQQALSDAQARQAETARAGAESVQKAQEGVVSAERSLQGALAQQAAQQATVSSSAQKLATDMAKLSPAGQEFAHFIHDDLSPKVKELQATAQQGLLPGVELGLRAMFPVFPAINGLIGTVSTSIGDMAHRTGVALNDPFWRGFIAYINGEAGPSIRIFGSVLGNFATGGAALLEAFKPVWDQMGTGILGLSQRFSNFSQNIGQNKQFQDFLAYVKVEGPLVVTFLGDLIKAAVHAGEAMGPLGGVVLTVVDSFVRLISVIPTPVLGPLIDILYVGFLAWKAWLIIDTVTTSLRTASSALIMMTAFTDAQTISTGFATASLWLLNAAFVALPFVAIGLAIAALVLGVIYCYNHFQIFRDIVNTAWLVVKNVIEAVWNNTIKIIFDAISSDLRAVGDLFSIFGSVVNIVWQGLKIIFDLMTGNWQGVVTAFDSGMNSLQNIWNRLIDIAKIPVNFVINSAYNHGIVTVWDAIAGVFGLPQLQPVALLAGGGVIPGYSPGADTVPAMLSKGEGVLVPEAVRGLGADFVYAANAHFSGGRAPSTGNRFAGGGIVGDIASLVADPVGSVKSLFSGVTSAIIPGTGLLHQALVDIPGKVVDAVIAKAKALVTSVGAAFSAAFTGSPNLAAWIQSAIGLTGVPQTWAGPLSVLIGRESGGNPNAINLTDSNAAAGHPSQGLMQTIPGTFTAYHQAGTSWNITDPVANISAGINYIKARYGSIFNVQQANPNLPPKGYDSGGWLPPGVTMAYNGTGMAERVLTAPQFQSLTSAATQNSGPTINVYPRAEHSEADIADMVERRLSFAMNALT